MLRGACFIIIIMLMLTAGLEARAPASGEPRAVTVGKTELRLPPPEAILDPVDESDQKNKTVLKIFGWESGNLILGIYAEPAGWRAFKKGLTQKGRSAAPLNFYAMAFTPEALADADYDEDDFSRFKKIVLTVSPNTETLQNTPQALTFRTFVNTPESGVVRIIVSVILIKGKIIYLTIFDNPQNSHKDQALALALGWRDICLEENH